MFDDENVFPVGDIPDHVPKNRKTGKKLSKSTAFRWVYSGVRGVRLETCFIGGQRYTSEEALHRFFVAIAAAADGMTLPAQTPKQREHAIQQAERELEQAGL